MQRDIQFIRVKSIEKDDFFQCINIYHEAFPAYERQPDEVIASRVKEGTCILIAGKTDQVVVCLAIVWEFQKLPIVFLDYFAVSANVRGQGVGKMLLNFLIKQWVKAGTYMVMEVEHPDQGINKLERRQRIAFYEKAGAVVINDLTYFLPPLGGATEPMEMKLMMVPDPKKALSESDYTEIIKTIYREVYGASANKI